MDNVCPIVGKDETENKIYNRLQPNIHFSLEIKKDGQLPFLDLNIHRKLWTSNGLFPNFNQMIHTMLPHLISSEDVVTETKRILNA